MLLRRYANRQAVKQQPEQKKVEVKTEEQKPVKKSRK